MSFTSPESPLNETFGKDASFTLPQLIGAMSISPSGRDVVLASKEGLRIIDLDSPYSPPRLLPHRTPWEVADVQWSPFADRDYWIISTSNQKALVWNVNAFGWRNSIEHVLHGHTRAITDINFSAHHPDRLATCAVDSFVHCWDLRCPSPLVNSFSDWFAGATSVKWSRQDEHVIASAHDRFLHIWDDRYGARPARTIEAHDTKIYGIDWNRFEPSKIVTCSLDKTIKFWDTQKEENKPDRTIRTDFPVWRARHTPFGWGLMVMPQRGNGDLHLYDRRAIDTSSDVDDTKPVHIFSGHKGQVKEFLWRAVGTVKDGIDHRDFQLVSWGTDHELRLHVVPNDTFGKIGYEKGTSKPQRLRFTRRGARYRTFRDEPSETEFAVGALSRADSTPSSNQLLRVRGRLSTNMAMNRAPVAQFKGWLQTGKFGRKTDMHGRGTGRPDTDPITWMKSVKIGAAWDNGSLAEELTSVGDKFKRIDFEMINITQRRATASLQSPWGEDKTVPVYMRLDFKFPKLYPKDAQAIVHVQRTNSITSDLQKSLSADINTITEAHKNCGRGCVEAVFSFILREQTLDQIVAMTLHDSMSESRLIASADEAGDASEDSDDDQAGPASRVYLIDPVPLTKGCAALWAENGRLVCFFEHKENESTSLLNALGVGRLDDPETKRLFGGFGRFQVDSPSRKMREKPGTIEEDSDSGLSDQSSLFSSSASSSDSSMGLGLDRTNALWQRPRLIPAQQDKSADGSQKSTVLDTVRASEIAKKTTITLHDFSQVLPAQKSVACEYRMVGDITIIVQHNMSVAERHSLKTVSATWRLVHNFFSLPTPPETREKMSESITLHQHDSAKAEMHSRTGSELAPWMNHLAVTQIFPSLLQFYEKTCDVQTLGMLAGIFLQTQMVKLKNLSHTAGIRNAEFCRGDGTSRRKTNSRLHRPQLLSETPVESHTNAAFTSGHTSHSQSPNDRVSDRSQRVKDLATSTISARRTASINVASRAPSVIVHNTSGPVSTINSAVTSVAGSPENYRISNRKSEPVINYPMATASLQALAKSRPPSPTGTSLRRFTPAYESGRSSRVSPDTESLRLSRTTAKSSLTLTHMNASSSESQNFDSYRMESRSALKSGCKKSSVNRSNRKLKTKFADPHMSVQKGPVMPDAELLKFCRRCVSYARQYAVQLEAWQLWVQKAELIKMCTETSALLDKIDNIHSDNLRAIEEPCLTFRWCCPCCAAYMAPIERNGIPIGWQCVAADCASSTSKISRKQRCSICETVILGLAVPCTQCGHITCYECAEGWFGPSFARTSAGSNSTSSGVGPKTPAGTTCPTGCGCRCSQLEEVSVPYPNIEDNETEVEKTVTPTTPRSEGYQEHADQLSTLGEHRARRGQSIGNIDPGATTAMNALLALNLASRHRSTSGATKTLHGVAHNPSLSQASGSEFPDELLPWAHDRNASLARGGRGLSRGLSSKDSSSTIRKADGHG